MGTTNSLIKGASNGHHTENMKYDAKIQISESLPPKQINVDKTDFTFKFFGTR